MCKFPDREAVPEGVSYEPPENLTVEELRHLDALVKRRLHSMAVFHGVNTFDEYLTLPLDSYPERNRVEAAFFQRLGEKLCKLLVGQ